MNAPYVEEAEYYYIGDPCIECDWNMKTDTSASGEDQGKFYMGGIIEPLSVHVVIYSNVTYNIK